MECKMLEPISMRLITSQDGVKSVAGGVDLSIMLSDTNASISATKTAETLFKQWHKKEITEMYVQKQLAPLGFYMTEHRILKKWIRFEVEKGTEVKI
jgi:uncharacterized cupredoxin-like copper-binding protein